MYRRINPIFDFENEKFAIFEIQFLNGLELKANLS